MAMATPRRQRARGQAAVEAAVVMPLTVFLVLGTLQLFLMLQARLMAQYAAWWAAREGSVTQGSCGAMEDVALKALLPTFVALRDTGAVEAEASARRALPGYRYDPRRERGFSGDIFWVARERPLAQDVTREGEEAFDQGEPVRLEVRLVFWYPLRVPFADAALTRLWRAFLGAAPPRREAEANPLLPVENAVRWREAPARLDDAALRQEYARRTGRGEYVFPIVTTASMRMLTPPAPEHFESQDCAASPGEVTP